MKIVYRNFEEYAGNSAWIYWNILDLFSRQKHTNPDWRCSFDKKIENCQNYCNLKVYKDWVHIAFMYTFVQLFPETYWSDHFQKIMILRMLMCNVIVLIGMVIICQTYWILWTLYCIFEFLNQFRDLVKSMLPWHKIIFKRVQKRNK